MDSECCECTSAVPYTFLQYHIYLPEDNHWDSPLPPGISGSASHLPVKPPESSLHHHRPLCNPMHQNLQFLHCSDPRSYRQSFPFYPAGSRFHMVCHSWLLQTPYAYTDKCQRNGLRLYNPLNISSCHLFLLLYFNVTLTSISV